VITKVVHGWRVGGLIAYLMGPGRAQEHVDPRVIASWDGRDAVWQPDQAGGDGLGPLIRALRAPAIAAGLPEQDGEGRRGYVWHCSARVAATDRVLSDAEWADIARELLDGSDVARRGDSGGPRWVAVRHADDHIHLAVVLVRQDTGRRFWPSHDYPRLRETARRIERRLGLTLTAGADGTAAVAPGRGELEKAHWQGREPARVELARVVRQVAVAASGLDEFVAGLRSAGYLVELRRAPSGDPLGYKVARPADAGVSQQPVFYSGSKLAPDLSLPRLLRAWEEAAGGEVASPWETARRRTDHARSAVRGVRERRTRHGADTVEDVAEATGAVLTALSCTTDELCPASEAFARAARRPRGRAGPSTRSRRASALRGVARQLVRQRRVLARMGVGARDDPGPAVVALVVALTVLVREIAGWQRDHDRTHQSEAALGAARHLERWLDGRADAGAAGEPASVHERLTRTSARRGGHVRADAGPRSDRAVPTPSISSHQRSSSPPDLP
jgi:hypothetical protein